MVSSGMTTVTADIAVSLDGFAAGPNQSEELPFGEGLEDEQLHTWMFDHRDENRAEVDAITGAGAYIMGRNMFSPGRGEWDLQWKGWWVPVPVTRCDRRTPAARRADHAGRGRARLRRRRRSDVRHRPGAADRARRPRHVAATRSVIDGPATPATSAPHALSRWMPNRGIRCDINFCGDPSPRTPIPVGDKGFHSRLPR
jgi:hypothetical protein